MNRINDSIYNHALISLHIFQYVFLIIVEVGK